MKLLIAGNSQSAALKRAYEARVAEFQEAGLAFHFYVIPGGSGPDFQIEDGRLVPGKIIETHPPFMDPADTNLVPLESYDGILLSALGYFDGGFKHKNRITRAGVLAECGPRGEALKRNPVSDTALTQIVRATLERQNGIRTLRRICEFYEGPVYVQRWPRLSEDILSHGDWGLRRWYAAPVKAYQILAQASDTAMNTIADETGAQLLDYPDFDHPRGFSPANMMKSTDCLHQADTYADLILDQILTRIGTG